MYSIIYLCLVRDTEAKETLLYAASVNNFTLPPFELDNSAVLEEEKLVESQSVFDFFKRDRLPLMIPLWCVVVVGSLSMNAMYHNSGLYS